MISRETKAAVVNGRNVGLVGATNEEEDVSRFIYAGRLNPITE